MIRDFVRTLLHCKEKGHTLRVTRESSPLHFLGGGYHTEDESWTYVDAAGHYHHWQELGDHYPTLKYVTREEGFYEDGSPMLNVHQECVECGEWIVPDMVWHSGPMTVHGLTRYYVDDVEVNEEDFNHIREGMFEQWKGE